MKSIFTIIESLLFLLLLALAVPLAEMKQQVNTNNAG
jgi:hypothetical protein